MRRRSPGALGVAAGLFPVWDLKRTPRQNSGSVGFDRNGLPEPVHLPAACRCRRRPRGSQRISPRQVTEATTGAQPPLSRSFAAVISLTIPRQGAQVPSARLLPGPLITPSSPPGPGLLPAAAAMTYPQERREWRTRAGLDILAGERPRPTAGAGGGTWMRSAGDPKLERPGSWPRALARRRGGGGPDRRGPSSR